jgi:hypothetical protein
MLSMQWIPNLFVQSRITVYFTCIKLPLGAEVTKQSMYLNEDQNTLATILITLKPQMLVVVSAILVRPSHQEHCYVSMKL